MFPAVIVLVGLQALKGPAAEQEERFLKGHRPSIRARTFASVVAGGAARGVAGSAAGQCRG
eukprot:3663452-Alexandrium_andersonii.AAC.1